MAGSNDSSGLESVSKTLGLTITNGTTNGAKNGDTSSEKQNGTKPKKPVEMGETKAEKVEDDATPGSVSTVKNIYKSKKDGDGNWTWINEYPEDVPEAAENDETAKFALVVRNKKSQDSRKKLEADSIVIQSPWLRKALSEILADYPGVACELKRLVFEAPFQPFVHRWADFSRYMKKKDLDATTREHLNLLQDILKYEIGDTLKAFEDYIQNGVITFDHLWMIFQPGGLIVRTKAGPLAAFELDDTEYMENRCGKFLRLKSECVDWSGKYFGRGSENIDIPEFFGTKKITTLSAYPLHFDDSKELIRAKLTERGKLFESLAGHHYKAYSGTAITWDKEGNEVAIQVSGRIIVDTNSFNRFSPYYSRYVESWNAKDLERLAQFKKANPKLYAEEEKKETYSTEDDEKEQRVKLSPYHQMLCRARTRGYSLKLKKWLDFFVDLVEEIKWNNRAFDSLVLPEDQKELILAFSESQVENRQTFDDVIQGKGKGIILLLSGKPGIGKTLTAEAVAENMRVPLHTISSGDLGSSPWEVERGLTNILDLVARWNAILLLDECDVFLEARSTHDLERNKIVSIFLRTLEYYEGIMFMTTNRVDNIDAAFQSRIHVSMEYPALTAVTRRKIWENFLKSSTGGKDFSDQDLDELAGLDLNGRQIKNILKTSQLLAIRKKENLNRKFVETVLAIEKRRPEVTAQGNA